MTFLEDLAVYHVPPIGQKLADAARALASTISLVERNRHASDIEEARQHAVEQFRKVSQMATKLAVEIATGKVAS